MTFEEAYKRLEEILAKMNSGKIALDDSLKLYEEADMLIASCNKRLLDAEKKIETLVKTRTGTLVLKEDGEPLTEEFSSNLS